jgi:hypothetical protein
MTSGLPPVGSTINVYGTVNSAGALSLSGGGLTLNIYAGANLTFASIGVSAGTHTFTNCGTMTIPSGNFSVAAGTFNFVNYGSVTITTGNFLPSGGTVTIDNYGTIRIPAGKYFSSAAGVTFHNYAGGSLLADAAGNGLSVGVFINDANTCTTSSFLPSGGTFTNNGCISTGTYAASGGGTYTNNASMNIYGDFSVGAGTPFTNNGLMTINGNFSNSGSGFTNNGTINITGNFLTSTSFIITDKSQVTSADWRNQGGTITGPAAGCGSFIATGNTNNSGTIVAGNSSHVDIYDTGVPAAVGTPAFRMDLNSGNVNAATATGTCTTNAFGFANCKLTCSVLLPIELLAFSAQLSNDQVVLLWSTGTETNNDYFTIERSADGENFEHIAIVKGAGNSSSKLSYNALDKNPLSGISYYRLKQTDYDGKFTYSTVVAVENQLAVTSIIYPNPSNGKEINISVSGVSEGEVLLLLYNSFGQIISSKTIITSGSDTTLSTSIDSGNDLASGVYYIAVRSKNELFRKKLVVSTQK